MLNWNLEVPFKFRQNRINFNIKLGISPNY
jgi:hypothetical protein